MKYKKITALALTAVMAGMMVTGCGNAIDADAVVATLDDREISLGFANFMAHYQQASYDSYYISWMGTDMWSQDLYGTGNTFQEDVKSEVITSLEDLYVLESHMADYGVEITEEDTQAMEAAADEFLENNSNEAITQVGATKEYIVEMLRLYTVQNRMYEAIIAEADTEVSDEEAAQRTFSYVSVSRNDDGETADSETEGDASASETEGDVSATEAQDESQKQQKKEMKAYAKEAAADFDKAAEDAGYSVNTASYGSAEDEDATLDKALLEAADKLKEGEVSGLVETENYYYVLRLDREFDEEATESKRESIISTRQSEQYTNVLDGYKEAVEWEVDEDVWAAVTFDELFTMTEETEDTGVSDETESTDVSGETEDTGVSDETEDTQLSE